VHTWDDTEFHPVGEIKNRFLRAVYNFFEIFVGIIFISLLAQFVMPGHPVHGKKFRAWKALLSLLFIAIFLAGIGLLSHLAFGVSVGQIVIPFIASIWLNSFIVHHSQMIEHGNLIVDGSFDQRNIWARNLRDTAWPEKVFLFFTHGDSREHVLHHTMTSVYSRPFPHEIALPEHSFYINLKEYMGVLGHMLKGKTDTVKPEQNNQQ
jgi:uncharacterized MAPEG superfamily protein